MIYPPLTRMFCSVACKNKDCFNYPTPEKLKEAKVVVFQPLKRLNCGYVAREGKR